MNNIDLEASILQEVNELTKEIDAYAHISIINMQFLAQKGIIDIDEYKDFVGQKKKQVVNYLKSSYREDEAAKIEDNFDSYMQNF
ncbi:hypothetical protein [Acinetobacter guillouiae]|uniref:hypothetical protein n=1 Tax=Acinetobacter guillouiae TaxID=106649 RepID=UPI002FDAA818